MFHYSDKALLQNMKGFFSKTHESTETPRLQLIHANHPNPKGIHSSNQSNTSPPSSPQLTVSPDTPITTLNPNINEMIMDELIQEVADEIDHQYGSNDGHSVIPKENHVHDIDHLFERVGQLGSGATSQVYKARHIKTGRMVAIKEIPKSEDSYKSFLHERELLRKLYHPNILKYQDCFEDETCYYITTQYCAGGTMLDRICRMGSFSEKKASQYIQTILAAVSYMHSLDIVHRDLKCQNLVFDRKGSSGRLQVIDFGESLTVYWNRKYHELTGTIHYLPPEVTRVRTAAEMKAGDIWSIGVVAYILVTGRPPFGGQSQEEILQNIMSKEKKLTFPHDVRLTKSCKSFIRGLLCDDPKVRPTAELALKHPWISGDGASTADLCASYLQSLKHYNHGNALQNVMVHALLDDMHSEDQKEMNESLLELTRINSQVRSEDVVDFLLLHSKVTERRELLQNGWTTRKFSELNEFGHRRGSSFHMTHTGSYPKSPLSHSGFLYSADLEDEEENSEVNVMDLFLAEKTMEVEPTVTPHDLLSAFNVLLRNESIPKATTILQRVSASEDQIVARKISPERFTAIMKTTSYDVDAIIDELQDEDGLIPLDGIAHYELQSGDE